MRFSSPLIETRVKSGQFQMYIEIGWHADLYQAKHKFWCVMINSLVLAVYEICRKQLGALEGQMWRGKDGQGQQYKGGVEDTMTHLSLL